MRVQEERAAYSARLRTGSLRRTTNAISEFCASDTVVAAHYARAREIVRVFRKPAFYEITQRCNLRCEGCYYFADLDKVDEAESRREWERHFAAEAGRKVTMAYFVGAEPSLKQDRLFAASRFFRHGNVGTNGIVRIDPVIPFRIAVSAWAGDDSTDRLLRGASAFRKAFKNYAGDPRAIIYFTLTRWNLGSVRTVAEMCRDHDLPLTFNLYSPTREFIGKLRSGSANDDRFFRRSSAENNPCFDAASLAAVRRVVLGLIDEFPETIVYSRTYNDWITREGAIHDIDPATGVAERCGSRITSVMRYYTPDLRETQPKCCTPAISCSECRMLSGGWSTRLVPHAGDLADAAAFSRWLDLIDVLGSIFLLPDRRDSSSRSAEPRTRADHPLGSDRRRERVLSPDLLC